MLRIFRLCTIPDGRTDRTGTGTGLWFYFSHVCQRWRDMSLGFAELWSTFTARDLDMATEVIARSRSAPLALRIALPRCIHENDDDAIGSAQMRGLLGLLRGPGDSERLRALELLVSRAWAAKASEHLDVSLPLLESLIIVGCRHRDKQPFKLSDAAFADTLPRLRALKTLGVRVSLPSQIAYNLRSLHLTATGHAYDAFIAALRDMQVLEDLHLEDGFDENARQPRNPTPFSLPNLRHLCVTDYPETFFNLVKSASLPRVVAENVDLKRGIPDASDAPNTLALGSALGNHLSSIQVPFRLTWISVANLQNGDGAQLVSMKLWSEAADIDRPSLALERVCFGPSLPALITGMNEHRVLSEVTKLQAEGPRGLSARVWQSVCVAVPQVQTLVLENGSLNANNLLSLITTGTDALANLVQSSDSMLPMLETIIVQRGPPPDDLFDVSIFGRPSQADMVLAQERNWVALLAKLFRRRHSAGMPLRNLQFVGVVWDLVGELRDAGAVVTSSKGLMHTKEEGNVEDTWVPDGCRVAPTFERPDDDPFW